MHALGINSQFCLGERFWKAHNIIYVCQIWSPKGNHFWQGGPILAAKTGRETTFGNFLPKSVRGTNFGGTDFGVTAHTGIASYGLRMAHMRMGKIRS